LVVTWSEGLITRALPSLGLEYLDIKILTAEPLDVKRVSVTLRP